MSVGATFYGVDALGNVLRFTTERWGEDLPDDLAIVMEGDPEPIDSEAAITFHRVSHGDPFEVESPGAGLQVDDLPDELREEVLRVRLRESALTTDVVEVENLAIQSARRKTPGDDLGTVTLVVDSAGQVACVADLEPEDVLPETALTWSAAACPAPLDRSTLYRRNAGAAFGSDETTPTWSLVRQGDLTLVDLMRHRPKGKKPLTGSDAMRVAATRIAHTDDGELTLGRLSIQYAGVVLDRAGLAEHAALWKDVETKEVGTKAETQLLLEGQVFARLADTAAFFGSLRDDRLPHGAVAEEPPWYRLAWGPGTAAAVYEARTFAKEVGRLGRLPDGCTAEALDGWLLFRGGYFLTGATFPGTFASVLPKTSNAVRQRYLEAMRAAFAALDEVDRRVLAIAEVADDADDTPHHVLATKLGMTVDELIERRMHAKALLRAAGAVLYKKGV